jgi:hypothetical protein
MRIKDVVSVEVKIVGTNFVTGGQKGRYKGRTHISPSSRDEDRFRFFTHKI